MNAFTLEQLEEAKAALRARRDAALSESGFWPSHDEIPLEVIFDEAARHAKQIAPITTSTHLLEIIVMLISWSVIILSCALLIGDSTAIIPITDAQRNDLLTTLAVALVLSGVLGLKNFIQVKRSGL